MEHAAYGQLPQRVGGMQGHDRPVIPGHHHPPSALPSMTPSDENKAMMQGMNDPRAMAIARDDVQHRSGMLVPVPLRVPGPANAGGAAAGGATPNVSEEEMLRRTLVELLVENEALRGALHEGGPGAPGPASRNVFPSLCQPTPTDVSAACPAPHDVTAPKSRPILEAECTKCGCGEIPPEAKETTGGTQSEWSSV